MEGELQLTADEIREMADDFRNSATFTGGACGYIKNDKDLSPVIETILRDYADMVEARSGDRRASDPTRIPVCDVVDPTGKVLYTGHYFRFQTTFGGNDYTEGVVTYEQYDWNKKNRAKMIVVTPPEKIVMHRGSLYSSDIYSRAVDAKSAMLDADKWKTKVDTWKAMFAKSETERERPF